jgi:hypothetical protein
MASSEKRTQVYLTEEQHRRATALARARSASLASVVREALDRYLATETSGTEADWKDDPALALVGQLELPARPPGTSLNEDIDLALYEEETATWSSPTRRASSRPSTGASRATRRRHGPGASSRAEGKGSSRRSSSSPRR